MRKFKLNNIIIGRGYIGSYLKNNFKVAQVYNSKSINKIKNKKFNIIYLAAPSSKKYLANKFKKKDLNNIKILINVLRKVECKKIICISTIDTFTNMNSKENSKINFKSDNNYGLNRNHLNDFIKKKFNNYLIIKLPSLFGNKEKKGFFYDLNKSDMIEHYNINSTLQWYYTPYLKRDIKKIIKEKIKEINLLSAPISCSEINKFLNLKRKFSNKYPKVNYNIQSIHNYRNKKYSYKKKEILKLMKNYFQSKC